MAAPPFFWDYIPEPGLAHIATQSVAGGRGQEAAIRKYVRI